MVGPVEEVVTELIRSLPKPIRRNYEPAPNFAKAFLERGVPLQEPLTVTMAIRPTQIQPTVRCGSVPFGAANWTRPSAKAAIAAKA